MNLLKLYGVCQLKHRNIIVITMMMFSGNHVGLLAQETALAPQPQPQAILETADVESQTLELGFESMLEKAMADNPETLRKKQEKKARKARKRQ